MADRTVSPGGDRFLTGAVRITRRDVWVRLVKAKTAWTRRMAESFYIIDGHAQVYRAFYAPFRDLTSPSGEPTRATYVFCQMLFNLIRARRPDYLAMAMDVSDETVFRREIDPNYKANRDPAPEALHVQLDRIVSIVETLGIPVYRLAGFEADDLMATMTCKVKDQPVEVFLVSGDKDLHQLLSDKVRLLDPGKDKELSAATLIEKTGYTPLQAVEVQTLAGDPTDNIPGVRGVGMKTASKLITTYGTADAVLAHADELTPKMQERVRAFADQLPITRKLVTLRPDVPMDFDLQRCKLGALNVEPVTAIFDELGFGRLKETLRSLGRDAEPASADKVAPSGAPSATPAAASDRGPTGNYELVDSPTKLEAFINELRSRREFAFDTETTGLNPVASDLVGISFSWKAGEAYYIPVRGMMGAVLPVDTVVKAIKPIMENPAVRKVGQNIKYDIVVLRQVGIRTAGIAFDTMIASFLLDPMMRSHSLDYLSEVLCDHRKIPTSDIIGKGKSQVTMDQVDIARVAQYAGEDADFTWRLKEIFEPQLAGSHAESLFRETEMPLVEVLAKMEHNGITLDTGLLAQLSASMAKRLEKLSSEVHEAAGYQFNIDSTKQLAVVLFDEQNLPVGKKTKTGRSTDAETLTKLCEQTDNIIPKLVLEYRELRKLKGTYLDTLPQMICPRTGRVHASFNQIGAVTGRLSSSDPNLQNIPIRTETGRRIREAVVPGGDGKVLLSADYSQIELRLLAHFCEDATLIEAFREGRDIHQAVAAQIEGVALEEVTKEQRSAAKAINFGIIYGQTAFGLSRTLNIPVGEAKAFIDAYFMRYPGIRLFIDGCIEHARRVGHAETILGRRRPIPELNSRNAQQRSFGERIAVNTVVQGSAADLIKRAMIDIHRELHSGQYGAKMLIQVHDELVFEIPAGDVEREAAMIREKMEHAMELKVPIVADVAWGRSWAEGK